MDLKKFAGTKSSKPSVVNATQQPANYAAINGKTLRQVIAGDLIKGIEDLLPLSSETKTRGTLHSLGIKAGSVIHAFLLSNTMQDSADDLRDPEVLLNCVFRTNKTWSKEQVEANEIDIDQYEPQGPEVIKFGKPEGLTFHVHESYVPADAAANA